MEVPNSLVFEYTCGNGSLSVKKQSTFTEVAVILPESE